MAERRRCRRGSGVHREQRRRHRDSRRPVFGRDPHDHARILSRRVVIDETGSSGPAGRARRLTRTSAAAFPPATVSYDLPCEDRHGTNPRRSLLLLGCAGVLLTAAHAVGAVEQASFPPPEAARSASARSTIQAPSILRSSKQIGGWCRPPPAPSSTRPRTGSLRRHPRGPGGSGGAPAGVEGREDSHDRAETHLPFPPGQRVTAANYVAAVNRWRTRGCSLRPCHTSARSSERTPFSPGEPRPSRASGRSARTGCGFARPSDFPTSPPG